MKEQELDKYVEKVVRLTDTDNDTHEGNFIKLLMVNLELMDLNKLLV